MKITSYVNGQHLYLKCTQRQPLEPLRTLEQIAINKRPQRDWKSPILSGTDQENGTNVVDQITFNQISIQDIDCLITALQEAKEKYENSLPKAKNAV